MIYSDKTAQYSKNSFILTLRDESFKMLIDGCWTRGCTRGGKVCSALLLTLTRQVHVTMRTEKIHLSSLEFHPGLTGSGISIQHRGKMLPSKLFDFLRFIYCSMRTLNWIIYEPIWKRCCFRFRYNINEPLGNAKQVHR